jgi:hypothetical protein
VTDVSETISAIFDKAEDEDGCAAQKLRALYEAGEWESGEIAKAIAISRETDEAG